MQLLTNPLASLLLLFANRDVDKILQIILGIDTTDNVEAAASAILTCGMSKSFWNAIAVNGGGIQFDPGFTRHIEAEDIAKDGASTIPTTKEDHGILIG